MRVDRPTMPTLTPELLATLPAHINRPRFDRSQLRPGIVHLGLGAFVRAFMLPLLDAALDHGNQGFDGKDSDDRYAWGVIGYSLRQPDTRDALTPQQGLYTLLLRDADPDADTMTNQTPPALRERLQVIGSLISAEFAADTANPIDAQIASPDTRIVSLTLTEKGYLGTAPNDALPCLLQGLKRRYAQGLPPVTVLSLDNLSRNGQTTRARLLALADADEPSAAPSNTNDGFRDWLAHQCRYPCSMVDRIVPASTDRERLAVKAQMQADDAWPVAAEPYWHWVLEDDFVGGPQGRPNWPGVSFVASLDEVLQWEANKLRMVNGAHSMLAYLAVAAGWATVDQALAALGMRPLLARLLHDEVIPSLLDRATDPNTPQKATQKGTQKADLQRYADAILDRFGNPALAHQTRQIAMDGSQKLPLRLIPTAIANLNAGRPCTCIALAVAAWIQYQRGHDDAGHSYPVMDPQADALAAHARSAPTSADSPRASTQASTQDLALARHWSSYQAVFGELSGNPVWLQTLSQALSALQSLGAARLVAGCGSAG